MRLEAFDRFGAVVEKYILDVKELLLIYNSLVSFMGKFRRDTNPAELSVYFTSLHSNMSAKDREVFDAFFTLLAEQADVEQSVVQELLDALLRKQKLVDLAVASYEASEGRRPQEEVSALALALGVRTEDSKTGEVVFVTDDLEELHAKTISAPGLRWRLKSLNTSIGSLRKGDFGFVFARPETGKTTFLASECSFMASQAIGPVLWFNNEEQGEKVMLRCYQAALGATLEQLFSSISKAKKQFHEITKGNLRIVDQASITRRDVEAICQAVQPSLIVFDQIDKISGFAADRDDLVLGAIYQWARELAKTYCPVVGVCQADGTAEGVKWLTMSHVSNAKTSKQAEADWILGIGRSNEAGYEIVRHFNISKNKLIGDKDSIPDRRHDKWDVLIKPEAARYEDIIA